ncbi:MAG: redoxin domain-containing protein [Candidatus Eremiobacteraeota bacterium]|nr:redoxin domain-containing protein [Candidatus Eremiobacteraeota bacterium]
MNRAERRNVPPTRAALQAQATRRRIIIFSTLGLIAVGVIVAIALANRVPKSASTSPISAQLTVGQQAPEFTVSTTQGPFDLAQARGEPTLLEVFATWCPHCQRETTVLNGLYGAFKIACT